MRILLLILLFGLGACQQQKVDLTILHLNDTHAKHLATIRKDKVTGEVSTNGGVAELATLVKQHKTDDTLFLHGGDIVTGSVFSLIYYGLEAAELLDMIHVDVSTLGNHEFDFGLSNTYAIMSNKKTPSLSANVFEYDTSKPVALPYITTNIKDQSIAIIGITSSEDVYTIKDKDGGIRIDDEIKNLKDLFANDQSLKTNDIFILLSHSGVETDKKIAKAFPNKFSLIVGGHSHTKIEKPIKIGNTLIVQTENNGFSLGKLDATFVGNKIVSYEYKHHPIKNIEPDPVVAKYVAQKKIKVDQELGQTIGTVDEILDDENIRMGSKPLGNYVTDTVYNNFAYLNPDMVLVNSGSIRSTIPDGNISIGTFYEVHPFDNVGVLLEITGKDLLEAFKHSISLYDNGGFLQLSKGLKITVNPDKTFTATLDGKALDADKIYRVLVSDWLSSGGDGYKMFIPQKQVNTGIDFRDLLIQDTQKNKGIATQNIDKTDRWEFL